jgi:hypothetical protein
MEVIRKELDFKIIHACNSCFEILTKHEYVRRLQENFYLIDFSLSYSLEVYYYYYYYYY